MDGAAVAACGVCGVGGQTVVGEVHTVLEGVGAGGGGGGSAQGLNSGRKHTEGKDTVRLSQLRG